MKKKIIISAILFVALIIAIVVGCNLAVIYNGKERVFDRAEEVPHNTYGLLLATSPITPRGAHNFYFDNRITAADSLFKLGRIDYIIAYGISSNYIICTLDNSIDDVSNYFNAMKFCKPNINPEHIINILSINDTNWLTHIESSDVDYILDKATNIALQRVFGHNIKEAMLNLDLIEIDADKAMKALFLIRYNKIYRPLMFEISELSDRLTNLCPQADVLLGFASDCDIEYNVAITALTSY